MKVKLLRELLVEPSDTQATKRGTVVEMDDARARDLANRDTPLVELLDGEADTEDRQTDAGAKQAADPENKMAPDPENKDAKAASPQPTKAAGAAKTRG